MPAIPRLPRRWLTPGLAFFLLAVLPASMRAQSHKSPATSPARVPVDPLAALLQQAKDAIDKNDFDAAVEPLQKYIAGHDDDPFAHFQLGYAFAGLKRWADAKSEFSRAILLDPKMSQAQLNLGLVLLDAEPPNLAGAATAFHRTSELLPRESRPKYLEGYALERAENFPEAAERYRAALNISPNDYEYCFALGRVLLRSGNAVGAEAAFREAVEARAESAPAYLGLANALLAQKKYDAGTDALAAYLKLDPTDQAQRVERASALLEIDRFDDALAELAQVSTVSAPSAAILKMRAEIYIRKKMWQQAADTLVEALAVSPQDPELLASLGHVRVEMRDYPSAIKLLGEAYSRNPKSPDALRDLISAFFLSENYPAALGAMDRLALQETPKPMSWFVRAICYDKLSHKAEAVESYQKFLDLDHGQNDIQDFQARHRILTLQSEMGASAKKQKH